MKKSLSLFLVLLCFLSTHFLNAQTSVTSSGMSIQGIARDVNNEALANFDQLNLKFEVYYLLGSSTTPTVFITAIATVKTDNFGVFSYVLDIDQNQYNLISNNASYLKVSASNVVFSDEKLRSVPYAVFAQNGVPTGSIMPFIGTNAPSGWLLCDGSAIPSGSYYDNLKALAGANTPNLKGLFLRGAGGQTSYPGKEGPALKVVQQDDVKAHSHAIALTTGNGGAHNHILEFGNDDFNSNGGSNSNGLVRDTTGPNNRSLITNTAASHAHSVNGVSATNGDALETRPINFGVNYIIKI